MAEKEADQFDEQVEERVINEEYKFPSVAHSQSIIKSKLYNLANYYTETDYNLYTLHIYI